MKTVNSELIIRLRRKGYTKYAIFEIVLAKPGRRSFIEKLGFFNPQFSERLFFIDSARVVYWMRRGACLNTSVKRYLAKLIA